MANENNLVVKGSMPKQNRNEKEEIAIRLGTSFMQW